MEKSLAKDLCIKFASIGSKVMTFVLRMQVEMLPANAVTIFFLNNDLRYLENG